MPSGANTDAYTSSSPVSADAAENAVRSLAHIIATRIGRVVKRDGHRHFVVSVFLRRSQPTTKLTLISATERYFRTRPSPQVSRNSSNDALEPDSEPDYEVERRFSKFIELRHALQGVSHDHQSARDCAFCNELLAFLEHDKKRQPRNALQCAATSTRRMSEQLTSFTRDILALIVGATSSASRDPHVVCEAGLHAAALLADFLHKPRDSSLGII